jgi:hypothetical protein
VKEKEPAAEAKGKAKRSRKKGDADPLDGHAEKFFEEGEAMAEGGVDRHTLPSGVRGNDADLDANALGLVPHPARRGAFMRYVGIAVGLCAVVCLAAFVAQAKHAPAAVVAAPAVTAAAAAPVPEPVASAAPAASAAAAVPTPEPTASAAPAEQASAAPAVPTKTAKEEKADAERFLEKNRLGDAINSALRATSLDPEDADAWLLLGAAYQAAGKQADARLAYSECSKEAKRGEVRECRLMLR